MIQVNYSEALTLLETKKTVMAHIKTESNPIMVVLSVIPYKELFKELFGICPTEEELTTAKWFAYAEDIRGV